MRNHLISELGVLARHDPRIVILTADLGYSVLDAFAKDNPGRCLNVGICEQNMTAVAVGLALSGKVTYTYSIGNFPVMRCLEQVRNCVCYHNANVKIIAVGGGFVYGQLGMSHHATEDIAITRALPNMRVFCPADPDEAIRVVRHVHSVDGPCYVRLARGGEKPLHPELADYDVTKIMELRQGADVAVVATGPVVAEVLTAADVLRQEGVSVGVYNCMTLKPIDVRGIVGLARKYPAIVTVEEHNVIGGLGSAISETLFNALGGSAIPRLVKLGLQDTYTSVVGSQAYLRAHYGLASADIVKTVKALA